MGKKFTVEAKNEVLSRSLYIKLQKTIKGIDDVSHLVEDYERIVLKRKACRNCYVIYKDKEQQQKELEKLKSVADVYVAPRLLLNTDPDKQKPNKKKIKIKRNVVHEIDYGNVMLVKNIPCGTKAEELKAAFPGCRTLHFYKGIGQALRRAKLKMESSDITMEYVKKIREPPVIGGQKLLVVTPDFLNKLKGRRREKRKLKEKQAKEVDVKSENSVEEVDVKSEKSDEEIDVKSENSVEEIDVKSENSDEEMDIKSENSDEDTAE